MAKKQEKKKGWFQKGVAGAEMSKQKDVEAQARRDQKGPRRFWLENDSSAKVIFLDTPEFFLSEHNLQLGGKYFNFFTCIGETDTCPICEDLGNTPSYIVAGTIINNKSFKDKDGEEHKNQKQLFVAKGKARQLILRQVERRGGDLRGCVFEMTRGSGSTECSTGEDFEFVGRLKDAQIKKLVPDGADVEEHLTPFDYEEVFAPKSADELRKLVGGKTPVGSDEEKKGKRSSKEDEPEKNGKKSKKEEDNGGDQDGVSIDDLL